MSFDNYVRKFGKVSVGVSSVFVLTSLIFPCGSLLGGFLIIQHVIALIVALGLPLLWHWLKKDWPPLAKEGRRWAWYALGAVVASVPLMLLFEHGDGCLR